MIQERLGDVEYYVHDRLNVPLVVTDDDISGTFTFLRALEDHGSGADLSSREVGESWLNYLIKERTILWWGGLGNSTEHTAYLRLASGIEAPASGSMELNGKVVSEQNRLADLHRRLGHGLPRRSRSGGEVRRSGSAGQPRW